jgi:hypothetical protein
MVVKEFQARPDRKDQLDLLEALEALDRQGLKEHLEQGSVYWVRSQPVRIFRPPATLQGIATSLKIPATAGPGKALNGLM